jgi:hypothetical protein
MSQRMNLRDVLDAPVWTRSGSSIQTFGDMILIGKRYRMYGHVFIYKVIKNSPGICLRMSLSRDLTASGCWVIHGQGL